MESLGLSGLEGRLVGTYSGGQLARAGLAVALLGHPDLLILDEPTVGLDPVQFMPAFVLPQALLCGLVVPREHMTPVLQWLSDVLPLTYAVDAMQRLAGTAAWTAALVADVAIIVAFIVAALAGGALTLRRQTA